MMEYIINISLYKFQIEEKLFFHPIHTTMTILLSKRLLSLHHEVNMFSTHAVPSARCPFYLPQACIKQSSLPLPMMKIHPSSLPRNLPDLSKSCNDSSLAI